MIHLCHLLQPNVCHLKSWYSIFLSISLLVLTSERNECYFWPLRIINSDSYCKTPPNLHALTLWEFYFCHYTSFLAGSIWQALTQHCLRAQLGIFSLTKSSQDASSQRPWWKRVIRGPSLLSYSVSTICGFWINLESCSHELFQGKAWKIR